MDARRFFFAAAASSLSSGIAGTRPRSPRLQVMMPDGLKNATPDVLFARVECTIDAYDSGARADVRDDQPIANFITFHLLRIAATG